MSIQDRTECLDVGDIVRIKPVQHAELSRCVCNETGRIFHKTKYRRFVVGMSKEFSGWFGISELELKNESGR